MSTTITEIRTYTILSCYLCGVGFGVPEDFNRSRHRDGGEFFCPNGHGQIYRETDAQKLQRELDRVRGKLSQTEFELLAANKANRRLERRISNGVCPCCNRQFVQLARHMRTKHPEYLAK